MDATEQERLLIVKINHLAERLEAYTARPLAVLVAQLYAPADGHLHRGHTQAVADRLATDLTPDPDSMSLQRQLLAALTELQTSLPPALDTPAVPEPVYYALSPAPPAPPVPPMPMPRPPRRRSGIRKAAASIRGVVNKCRRQVLSK